MSDVLDVIAEEARANRTVVIEGRRKDGTEENREIEPYGIVRAKRTMSSYSSV
jgi:predicted DNA-binding transcriptional regulator YafY